MRCAQPPYSKGTTRAASTTTSCARPAPCRWLYTGTEPYKPLSETVTMTTRDITWPDGTTTTLTDLQATKIAQLSERFGVANDDSILRPNGRFTARTGEVLVALPGILCCVFPDGSSHS